MPLKSVVFDCDGVLIDTISSWRIIHDYFGTNSGEMLDRFMAGEITDAEFMADDIRHWKSVQAEIHRDELMRCYQGIQLNPGARDLVHALKEREINVSIVSAGVDLLVGAIANMLEMDDWASNGFEYCQDGFLQDEGVVRVPAHEKGEMVAKLCRINQFQPRQVCSVGDNHTDLSMQITGSRFIGFNPSKEIAVRGFEEAGVPIVVGNDCRNLWPHLFAGEQFESRR